MADEAETPSEQVASKEKDICRVCRSGSSQAKPLFHPCLCTGSMGYVHQDCLLQWLQHSGKKYCEVCNHQFTFAPIYRGDMPSRLSLSDIVGGVGSNAMRNGKRWLHLGLVISMWLLFVPICVCRLYKFLFFDSFWSITMLPLNILSLENWLIDCVYGIILVLTTLISFIGLVWLKDQVGDGKGPDWHEKDHQDLEQARQQASRIRVQEMHDDMELSSEMSSLRASHPNRLTVNRDSSDVKILIQTQVEKLQQLMTKTYDQPLEEMQYREMELYHRLGIPQRRFVQLLRYTQERHIIWEEQQMDRFLHMKAGTTYVPPPEPKFDPFQLTAVQNEPPIPRLTAERIAEAKEYGTELDEFIEAAKLELPPKSYRSLYGVGGPFDQRDIRVLSIFNEPVQSNLTIGERSALQGELDALQLRIQETVRIQKEHRHKLFQLLKLDRDEDLSMEGITPPEQLYVKRIRELQDELKKLKHEDRVMQYEANRLSDRERHPDLPDQQRWVPNFLRNDDVQDMLEFRRQRRHGNIGDALAGLARDGDLNNELDNLGDLTWDKLLGLDGSFKFLEHVLWIILLNSVIILVNGYVPYQVGKVFLRITLFWSMVEDSPFNVIYALVTGYLIFMFIILGVYWAANQLNFLRLKTILGLAYISLKVILLLGIEAGVFPLMGGWWMDICSFTLFGSVWSDRLDSLGKSPGTVTFFHWLAGMVYIFYFASLVMLLREVLRPGVLWFLRNLNDQNFHPVQEMINLPMTRHARRFLMSSLMFGTSMLLVLWLPCALVHYLWPGFLPYNLSLGSSVGPLHEIQLELLLLHFVLPTLLEHGNSRAALKVIVKSWTNFAAKLFSLQSYLLDLPQTGGVVVSMRGTVIREIPYDPNYDKPAYEEEPQQPGPGYAPFKPYLRPPYFKLRVIGFLIFSIASVAVFSALLLCAPVLLGRTVLGLFGIVAAPEIYTAAIGFYLIWLATRCGATIWHHTRAGLRAFLLETRKWFVIGIKCVIAGSLLCVVIPLLLGLLCDLIVIVPLRVPLDRHPIIYFSTDWALGLLHLKCMCGAIWLGNSSIKRQLERIYNAGIRGIDLHYITTEVAGPAIVYMSTAIIVPYLFAAVVVPYTGVSYPVQHVIQRTVHPVLTLLVIGAMMILSVVRQCQRMYQKVKDDKYLIGQRLLNYGE